MRITKRTALKIAAGLIMFIAAAILAQIFAAGYLFDRNIDKVLARAERRIPNLSLSYESTGSSLFSREGIISWEIKLPHNTLAGLDAVSGKSSFKLRIAPLKVSGAFEHLKGQGSFEKFLESLNLEPISYEGAFKLTALMPKASFALKTSGFHVPMTAGTCYIGESSVLMEAASQSDILAELNFAGFDCQGSEKYAGHNSFNARLEGLFVRLRPYIEGGRPYLDTIESGLKSLTLDLSTLFAIGFGPDEEVRDPTLRDVLALENVSSRISFTDKNDLGQGILNFDGSGNFYFAFPAVKEGIKQEGYRMDSLKLNGVIERISLTDTLQNLLELKNSSDLPKIMEGFSKPLHIALNEFSFENGSDKLKLNAVSDVDFAKTGSISDLKLDLSFSSAEKIVEDFAAAFAYQNELKRALEHRILLKEGSSYVSSLQVQDKTVTINGEVINNLHEGEDVVEEEPLLEEEAAY